MSEQSERLRARSRSSSERQASAEVFPTSARSQDNDPSNALDLRVWLEEHAEGITERWHDELRSRADGMDEEILELVGELLGLLTSLLPPGLGVFRAQAEGILQQAAELYGNLGAQRGLAAGEAGEEFQILREVILRLLYQESHVRSARLELRDLLQLNRLVDRGVTYVSIGHTDTLFFSLLHGTGVAGPPTPELLAAARDQIGAMRDELGTMSPYERT